MTERQRVSERELRKGDKETQSKRERGKKGDKETKSKRERGKKGDKEKE